MSSDGSNRAGAKGSRAVSRSEKGTLQFPVGRIKGMLKDGRYASRIKPEPSVYLDAVLEYLAAEVLELAGTMAKIVGKNRISPSHIMVALEQDEELRKLVGNVMFAKSSVV